MRMLAAGGWWCGWFDTLSVTGLKALAGAGLGHDAVKTIGGSDYQGCLIKNSTTVDPT